MSNSPLSVLMCADRSMHNLRYADAHFYERFQKLLNDIGKVFGVRILAVAVRPGKEGQLLVTV